MRRKIQVKTLKMMRRILVSRIKVNQGVLECGEAECVKSSSIAIIVNSTSDGKESQDLPRR